MVSKGETNIFLCYLHIAYSAPRPQLPATASNVCTTDAWAGGRPGAPSPNQNPAYAGAHDVMHGSVSEEGHKEHGSLTLQSGQGSGLQDV